jgi:ABC-type multidrug transport system permease subunit
MSKFALNVFAGLFIGSSFWNAGGQTNLAALQNKTFGTLLRGQEG